MLGLFHARKLRAHELAISAGWDRVHKRCASPSPSTTASSPAIAAKRLRARETRATWTGALDFIAVCHALTESRASATWRSSCTRHMPYVEGFGTYPFGEEWLFDAVARSYLPVLEVAERLTMTVTPVLADQLEADGVGERMLRVPAPRTGWARPSATPPSAERSLAAAGRRRGRALRAARSRALEGLGGDALARLPEARRRARIELMASAATHAVLPQARDRGGAAAADRRRAALPPAALRRARGLLAARVRLRARARSRLLAERGIALHLPRPERAASADGAALAPLRLAGGPTAFTIDWPTVELVWSATATRRTPPTSSTTALSPNGSRLWSIGGEPYDPEAAAARAREHARDVPGRGARAAARAHRPEPGRPGLCVFAIDTELLGHWWAEGPEWLAEVARRAAERGGVRL